MNSEPHDKAKPTPGQEGESEGLRLPEFLSLSGVSPASDLSPAKPAEMSSAEWLGLVERKTSAVNLLRFGQEGENEKSPSSAAVGAGPAFPSTSSSSRDVPPTPVAEPPSTEPETAEQTPATKGGSASQSAGLPLREQPAGPSRQDTGSPAVPPANVHVVAVERTSEPAPAQPLVLYTAKSPLISLVSDAGGRPAVVVALPGRVIDAGQGWARAAPGVRRLIAGAVGGGLAVLGVFLVWWLYPVDRSLAIPIEIVTARAPLEPVLREHRLALLSEDFTSVLRGGKALVGESRGEGAMALWQALREQKPFTGCPVGLLDRTASVPAVLIRVAGKNPEAVEPYARTLAELYRQWQTGLTQGGLSGRLDVEDRQNQRRQLQVELDRQQAKIAEASAKLTEAVQAAKEGAEQRVVLEKTRDLVAAEVAATRENLDKLLGSKGAIDFSPSAGELATAKRDEPAFQRVENQLDAARREHRRLLREAMETAGEAQKSLIGNLQELAGALAASHTADLPVDIKLVLQKISEEEMGWQLALYRLLAAWQTLLVQIMPGTAPEADRTDVLTIQAGAAQAVDQYQFATEQQIKAVEDHLHSLTAAGTDMAMRMAVSSKLASQLNRSRMANEQLKDALAQTLPQGSGMRMNLPLQSAVSREQAALRELANLEKTLKSTLTAKAQGDFERDREGQLRKAKAGADRAFNRLQQVQAELVKAQDLQTELQTKQADLRSQQTLLESTKTQLAARLATLDELISRLSQGVTLSVDRVEIGPTQEHVNASAETWRGILMFVVAVVCFGLGLGLVKAWGRFANQLALRNY